MLHICGCASAAPLSVCCFYPFCVPLVLLLVLCLVRCSRLLRPHRFSCFLWLVLVCPLRLVCGAGVPGFSKNDQRRKDNARAGKLRTLLETLRCILTLFAPEFAV